LDGRSGRASVKKRFFISVAVSVRAFAAGGGSGGSAKKELKCNKFRVYLTAQSD